MSHDDPKDKKNPEKIKDSGRRKTVRNILIGGGIISAGSQAPKKWGRPVVDSVLIPAHAQTSPGGGAPTSAPTGAPTAPPTVTGAPTLAPTGAPTLAPTGAPIPIGAPTSAPLQPMMQ